MTARIAFPMLTRTKLNRWRFNDKHFSVIIIRHQCWVDMTTSDSNILFFIFWRLTNKNNLIKIIQSAEKFSAPWFSLPKRKQVCFKKWSPVFLEPINSNNIALRSICNEAIQGQVKNHSILLRIFSSNWALAVIWTLWVWFWVKIVSRRFHLTVLFVLQPEYSDCWRPTCNCHYNYTFSQRSKQSCCF